MGHVRLSSSAEIAGGGGALGRPTTDGQLVPQARTCSDDSAPKRPLKLHASLKQGVAWAAAVVAASTIVFGLPSPIHVTAPGARAAIETLIASWALMAAAALLSSYRLGHQRSDLLLLTALAAVSLTDFVFSALPALADARLSGFGSALQVACDTLAAVAFAAAAFIPAGTLAAYSSRTLRVVAAAAVATIALWSAAYSLAGRSALDATLSQAGIAAAAQHPVLLAEAVFSSAILLVAGVGFLVRPEWDSHVLAAVSFLLASARLEYLALPVVSQDWVTAREGLRLAAYGLLLAVAISRYAQTRREIAAAALVVERERIARDLHDGLAQDLALIVVQGQQLSSELGAEHPLTEVARHAVAVSRGLIVDLSASTAASTETALRQVADELAARFGTEVAVRVSAPRGPAADDLAPARREEVVRIAREAIVNAARHGGARHIVVVFDLGDDEVGLRVSDDGRGMPQAKLTGRGGYGLQIMRARAATLGGRTVTRPAAEGGVEVEVIFPREPVVAR
jgi:signal transduction histidine kinase